MLKIFIISSATLIFVSDLILVAFSALGLAHNPSLFLLDIKSIPSILIGVFAGLSMAIAGHYILGKIRLWDESVAYLVGNALTSGGLHKLFIVSLTAGLVEETYTRGTLLLIFNDKNFPGFSFILAFILVNSIWSISHLFHRINDLYTNPLLTLKKALPHIIVIFITGIPFTVIAFAYNSLLPPILAHMTLDLAYGIFHRKKLHSSR
ncbi:Abortive infection protein [Desulfofundulus kuznetsovii DSM 6115]|uniref:Abortive infection protein n=1 Tax=Desulfofundulus kuznetsovii (strain DSM 6115 / VKM B-1805 / 17) TaxID=760568 RepID=A0AAU8PB84_DESK7|nr:Abortive infection protein [Desulfofundulus kuznetsovii DSM 6115]